MWIECLCIREWICVCVYVWLLRRQCACAYTLIINKVVLDKMKAIHNYDCLRTTATNPQWTRKRARRQRNERVCPPYARYIIWKRTALHTIAWMGNRRYTCTTCTATTYCTFTQKWAYIRTEYIQRSPLAYIPWGNESLEPNDTLHNANTALWLSVYFVGWTHTDQGLCSLVLAMEFDSVRIEEEWDHITGHDFNCIAVWHA